MPKRTLHGGAVDLTHSAFQNSGYINTITTLNIALILKPHDQSDVSFDIILQPLWDISVDTEVVALFVVFPFDRFVATVTY